MGLVQTVVTDKEQCAIASASADGDTHPRRRALDVDLCSGFLEERRLPQCVVYRRRVRTHYVELAVDDERRCIDLGAHAECDIAALPLRCSVERIGILPTEIIPVGHV